jgi:hypothetical protein
LFGAACGQKAGISKKFSQFLKFHEGMGQQRMGGYTEVASI